MAVSSPLAGVAYNGLSVTASAEKFVSNDYIYEGNGNNAVTITGYNEDNAATDIPDTLCGKRVTAIESNAFSGNKTITSMTVP